jgi:hypothetical protein
MTDDERIAALGLTSFEIYFLADEDFFGTPWCWENNPEILEVIERLLGLGVLAPHRERPNAYELTPDYADLRLAFKELYQASFALSV